VDVRELAYHCIRSHEADAAAAGITLNPVQPDEPVRAFVDPDRISQVIDNIIENSITYAGSGAQVSVSIDRGDGITITISDTGKGIRAEDLPHVLDPFYKADPARTPEDGHSGLGLSIAYRLAEAHGGNLTISSEEGKGTTVTVTLPGNRAASPS